jgi:small-conductance mechanosensitive channel
MMNYQKLNLLRYIIIIILTIFLIVTPNNFCLAQVTEQAPIVIDGREIFKIGSLENLAAADRAKIINQTLSRELNSSQLSELEIIQINQETVIRSKITERHLMTVTKNDLTQAPSIFNQAIILQNSLATALRLAKFERSPDYLRQASLYIAIVVFGAIALHLLLELIRQYINHQIINFIEHNFRNLYPWQQQFQLLLRLTILAIQIAIWSAIIYYITDVLPALRSWRYILINFLSSPIFTLGKSEYSAIGLVLLLLLTIAVWFISKAITEIFKGYLLSQAGVDYRAQELIGILSQYVITFFSLIVMWQIWGLDVGSLTILASVLGVGIGFGLQNIANDFISGLIITLERPIQIGDFVNVGDLLGTVERIGSRSTEIRTLDHVSIIVPNSRFLVNQVINWSHNDPISRIKIPVGVAYGSDVERVKIALLEAARSHPDVLLRPKPQVWFKQFGDSSLQFELLVWTGDPKKQYMLRSDLNYRIEESLRRHQLEVPFPQRDLHLRSPQLDLLITALLQQYGVKSPETPPENTTEVVNLSDSFSTLPNFINEEKDEFSELDLENIITAIKQNIEVKKRRYRLKNYSDCFISSEAIDWLMETQNWTREKALDFGQFLIEKEIIKSLTDTLTFADGYYLYQFA